VAGDDHRVGGAVAAAARNFATEPSAHRGPYEYSVPGHPTDFTPQFLSEQRSS
jgi:hypothetical protein